MRRSKCNVRCGDVCPLIVHTLQPSVTDGIEIAKSAAEFVFALFAFSRFCAVCEIWSLEKEGFEAFEAFEAFERRAFEFRSFGVLSF